MFLLSVQMIDQSLWIKVLKNEMAPQNKVAESKIFFSSKEKLF